MNISFPIIELIDRLVIAQIKFERTGLNHDELDWYQSQFQKFNSECVETEIASLKHIHNTIWALESDLKSFKEHLHSLEEIGRRAIEIRNLNHRRIQLKNSIAEKLNCPIKEIKKDHLSE